jgi:hypothetical protein
MSARYTNPYQVPFLVSFLVLTLSGLFLCSLAVLNKKTYPPFAAKQLLPLCLTLAASVFWIGGRLQILGMFGFDGIFSECQIWKYFCQCTIGVNLYLSVITFRLERLYFILVRKESRSGLIFWTPIVLPLLNSIVIAFLPYTIGMQSNYSSTDFACVDPIPSFGLINYGNVLLQGIIIMALNFLLRNVRKAMNEVCKITLFFITIVVSRESFGSRSWNCFFTDRRCCDATKQSLKNSLGTRNCIYMQCRSIPSSSMGCPMETNLWLSLQTGGIPERI